MLSDCLAARRQGGQSLPKLVFASNGSVIARYHRESGFRELMDQADIVDADGMPLVLFSRILQHPLPERIATTDFIFDACEMAQEHGLRFYFLGGKRDDNMRASAFFRDRYPGLMLVGSRDGYFKRSDEEEICAEIRERKVDVLWLGLGSPLQEDFAVRNRSRLAGVAWIRTCGGMFDHYSGRKRRAPAWMQSAGLEWLYRAAQEPRRLGPRYIKTNLPALYHLMTKTGQAGEIHPAGVQARGIQAGGMPPGAIQVSAIKLGDAAAVRSLEAGAVQTRESATL
ncbi:WecB/TagA/CpsF family glycosyltransferase [Alsobacter sp. KACC 23698]|uniref:WecB/TagA/CpsF family glycosyltransferase n=1 Tax=Alsobacter sp. KACC 23698 TaxID=3149229 RepID=A0AAU7JJI9_9HYPH